MENVRVLYIDSDTAMSINERAEDLTNEEFAGYATAYDLETFATKFNYEEISDLGYIRFVEV